jgi:hypothetical protein
VGLRNSTLPPILSTAIIPCELSPAAIVSSLHRQRMNVPWQGWVCPARRLGPPQSLFEPTKVLEPTDERRFQP